MTSDIDELLEWLRDREAVWRGPVVGKASEKARLRAEGQKRREADQYARWIAAVKGLVEDNVALSVTLAPPVGLQPMVILDPPERIHDGK